MAWVYILWNPKKGTHTPNSDIIKNPTITNEFLMVTPTGIRWNTFIETLLILDKALGKLDLESSKDITNII